MEKTDEIRSPLTGSMNVEVVNTLNINDLISRWQKQLQIDVSSEFKNVDRIQHIRCLDTQFEFFAPSSAAGSAKLYESLMNFDWYYVKDKWEYHEAIERIQPANKILEVGCGVGYFLKMVQNRTGVQGKGIEINEASVNEAQQNSLDVELSDIQEWAQQYPEHYDWVFTFQVVEHIADVGEFLRALIKLLKPGGSLAFSVPNNISFIRWDDDNVLNNPPHHMSRWRPEVVEHLKDHFEIDFTEVLLSPLEEIHSQWYVYLKMNQLFPIWPIPGIAAQTIGRLLKITPAIRQKISGHSMLAILKKAS